MGVVGGKKRRQSRKQIVGGEASLRRIQTFVLARRTFPLFHGNRLCLIKPGWGVGVGGSALVSIAGKIHIKQLGDASRSLKVLGAGL